MIARNALSLCILALFAFLPCTNIAPAQESNTAQRFIRDVLIAEGGGPPVIETGSGGALVSQGSWTAPKGGYRDPLGNFPRPSDHDLRVLIPNGMNQAEALQFYQQTRARVAARVRAKFGENAERVLRSVNIYPPEQLMTGVTTEAEAIERFSKLGIGTPNLGGLPPEGLWTEGRFPFARGYERTTGRIFYNKGGKMQQGFADIVSDIVSGADDAVAQTLVGASQNAAAFAQKVAHAVETGHPEDAIKSLQRTKTNLGKSFGLAGETSSTSYLDDLMAKIKNDPLPLNNPTLRQEILEAMKRATLEARLLERLNTASVADKELITRWLQEIRTGGTTGQKIMAFFGKLPLDKIALGLNTIFTFYQGYVIVGKIDEGDIEGALRETIVWAAFEAIGIGPGMMVMMANLLIEQAKSFGYDLMASTQDCEDLLAGVFTVRGREVNVLDDKVRPLTVDDLVAMYQRPQDLEGAIEYRSHHAAYRGLGKATGKSDKEVEKSLNDRCKREIQIKWTNKRMDLDRAFMTLYSAIASSPVSIDVQPDPAVLSDSGKPLVMTATLQSPMADIQETQKKMEELLDKLAGKHEYTVSVKFEWQLDGATLDSAFRQTIDFEIGKPGDHTLYGEMKLHIYSGINYGRSYPDVRQYKMTTVAVADKKGLPGQKDEDKKDDKTGGDKPGKSDEKDGQKPPPQVQPDSYTKGQIGIPGTPGTAGTVGVTPGTGAPVGLPPAEDPGKVGVTPGTGTPVIPVPPLGDPGKVGPTGGQTGIGDGKTPPSPPKEPPTCTYEYSAWGECDRGTKKWTRSVTAKKPSGCVEKGKPVLEERCTPPPTEEEKHIAYLNCLCGACGGTGGGYYNPTGWGKPCSCFGMLNAWPTGLNTDPKVVADCYKSVYGKSPTPGDLDKAVKGAKDENRKFQTPLKLTLTPEKCPVEAQLGDIITFTAAADGGAPPHKISWSGDGEAKDRTFTFANSRKPGTHPISVTVADDNGTTITKNCSVLVNAFTVTLKVTPAKKKYLIGSMVTLSAEVKAGKTPARGSFVFQWQPHPEVDFGNNFETAGSSTSGKLTRIGPVKFWVNLLQKEGEILRTVGESNQVEAEVVKPELELALTPSTPLVGQEVKAVVSAPPELDASTIDFWWEYKGNVLNPGPLRDNREYTFKPKDTKPVTIIVHGKAKDGGADLGKKEATITARAYEVSIGEPRYRGPKPKIWNPQVWKSPEWKQGSGLQGEGGLTPGGGLVEVADNQFAVFHDIDVKADVKPTPEKLPLRYDWAIAPSGICGIPASGQELRLNCSQTGTYTVTLNVRDSDNVVLGTASRAVSITVSQEDLENAKRPLVTLQADKTSLKTGETALIKAAVQGGKAPYIYRWSSGVEGKAETAQFSPKKSGAQNITVEVTDGAGKKNTAALSIKVELAMLEVTLKPAKTDIKLGETVDIKAETKGGEAPFTYAWGPGLAGNGDSAPFIAKKGGPQTISVEVMDKAQQKAKATVELKVEIPKLEVTLKADKTTLKTGETTLIQAIVKGGAPPVTSKWSADVVAKGEAASFTPKKSGAFKITVDVSDDAKQTANAGIDIKVEPTKLEVTLKADKTTLKLGETATLQATIKGGEPPLVSRWGSGVEGKGDSGRFVADKPGTHKASLEVSDQTGQKASASVDLKVEVPKLEVALTPDKPTLKVGEKGTIQAKVKGGMPEYTYQWSSFVSGKGETAAFIPTTTGSYKVWLEVRDKMGGKVSASLDWKVEAGQAGQTPQVIGPEKIAIEPENLKLALGETQTLQVLRILPDGRKEPVPAGRVQWEVERVAGVSIDSGGKVSVGPAVPVGKRIKVTAKADQNTATGTIEIAGSSKTPSTIPSAGTSTAAETGVSTTPGGATPPLVAAPLPILVMEPASLTIPPGGNTTLRVFTAETNGKRTDVTNNCTLTVSQGSGIRIDRNGRVTVEKTARPGAIEPVLAALKHTSGVTLRADGIIRIEETTKLSSGGYDPRTDPGKITTAKPVDADKMTKITGDFQKGQWSPLDQKEQKIKDQQSAQTQPQYLSPTSSTTPTTVPPGGTTTPTTVPPGGITTPTTVPSGGTTTSTTVPPGGTTTPTTGKSTTTTTGATPQNLTDVTVDRRDVTITVWDHGAEDGDIITIYLNGKVLKSKLLLTNKKQSFQVKLAGGQNRFEVEAVNEGSTPPNTATVEISNVTKGKPNQVYERKTGQRASMNLTAP